MLTRSKFDVTQFEDGEVKTHNWEKNIVLFISDAQYTSIKRWLWL